MFDLLLLIVKFCSAQLVLFIKISLHCISIVGMCHLMHVITAGANYMYIVLLMAQPLMINTSNKYPILILYQLLSKKVLILCHNCQF